MDAVLVAVRSVLAAVLLAAGASKLRSPRATAAAAFELGLPPRASRAAGVLIAPLEVLSAVLLVPGNTAFAGAVLTVSLLFAFTALVVANLGAGRRPPCRCFGSAAASPIGWWTVARNAVLLAAAGAVAGGGPSDAGPGVATALATSTGVPAPVAATAVVAAGAGIALAALARVR